MMAVGEAGRAVCLGLGVLLVACGGPKQHASSKLTVGGFAVASIAQTDDMYAPDEIYQGMQKPDCDRFIDVLQANASSQRAYSKVASVSVSCYYLALKACERRLIERACDLNGDAVIVGEPEAKPVLKGTITTRKEVTQSGQVIKFDAE